jgi:hypothetical protein
MRCGLALCLIPLGIAQAAAQTPSTWLTDSAMTPAGKVVVVGTTTDVRITMQSGARTKAVTVPGATAMAFADSVFAILRNPPARRPGKRDSASVSRYPLRFELVRTEPHDSLHFAITGQDGVDVQAAKTDGGHIIEVIATAAFWTTELIRLEQARVNNRYVDSAQAPGASVAVVGTASDVRITVRSGVRTKSVAVPVATALSFADAARAILDHPPAQRGGKRDSSSVSRDPLRFAFLRTDNGDSVHIAIAGPDGVELQAPRYEGNRMIGIISRAARWATEKAKAPPKPPA